MHVNNLVLISLGSVENRLMEQKSPGRFDLDDVAISEKVTNLFETYLPNKNMVHVGAIGRLKILAINEGLILRLLPGILLFVDDGVYFEMFL